MELSAATDLESLYEAAHRAELAAWKEKEVDVVGFMANQGPYAKALVYDTILLWIPALFLGFLFLGSVLGNGTDIVTCGMIAAVVGVIFTDTISKSRKKAGIYTGAGPFGWSAYRLHLNNTKGLAPERLDPWSSEAIAKAIGFTRRRLQNEQDAVLERIWAAKLDTGEAIRAGQEILERLSDAGTGDSLLRSARLDALRRMIERNSVVARELEAQERIVLETPNPVLARLQAFEVELLQRDAIAVLLNEEEQTQLREAEALAIRASVADLVGLVRSCEASLNGIRTEIGLQEAAERELRQALG
ncbi:hypothetical protein EON79_05485 [bacterium]|nr:MAG: hypothetical protein EON79_05485 [bacterium]